MNLELLDIETSTREVTRAVESGQPSYEAESAVGRRHVKQVLLTGTPLVVADLLSIVMSTLCVFVIAPFVWPNFERGPVPLLVFLCAALPIIFSLYRLYPGTGLNPIVELRQTTIATIVVFATFVAASVAHDGRQGYTSIVAVACALSVVVIPVVRSIVRRVCSRFRWWGQPVLIYGASNAGQKNYKYFSTRPYLGLRPVGIVDDNRDDDLLGIPIYVEPLERASSIADRYGALWAIVAMPERSTEEVYQVIERHARNIPHVLVVHDTGDLPTLWSSAGDCAGLLGVQMESSLLMPAPRMIKRALDLTIVTIGGLLCLLLLATIIVLIKISSRGPVFFGHERIGRGNRRFRAWKFRTMVTNSDVLLEECLAADPALREEWNAERKLRRDPRITTVGRWLRRTSLDELPQIWNVFCGEMSLVGPRPIPVSEFSRYNGRFDLYTQVLPGMSGLWQVSGRNNTSYAKRMRLDTYYVRNWSPWLDFYILARTMRVVLCQEGAY